VTTLVDLEPRVLRDLAAAIEARDPENRLRRSLPATAVDELSQLIHAGLEPDASWWHKWAPVDGPGVTELGRRLREAQRQVHAQLRAARDVA
jgi:hypothetical protein